VELQAATNVIRFIYEWVVNEDDSMRDYINVGMAGICTDHVAKLRHVVEDGEFQPFIRMANRDDNPFPKCRLEADLENLQLYNLVFSPRLLDNY
jgi:hypothetical protein